MPLASFPTTLFILPPLCRLGNRRWVDQLNWKGSAAWVKAEEEPWSAAPGGEAAGSVAAAGPLSFVKVYGAGHMVRGARGAAVSFLPFGACAGLWLAALPAWLKLLAGGKKTGSGAAPHFTAPGC